MKRRVFRILAGALLLVCVAMIALWVRSYLVGEYAFASWDGYRGPGLVVHDGILVASRSGLIEMHYGWLADTGTGKPFPKFKHEISAYQNPSWERSAFWTGFRTQSNSDGLYIQLPLWSAVSLNLILMRIFFVRSRRKIPPYQCATCGYDLRATPQRCPEYGAIPKQPA